VSTGKATNPATDSKLSALTSEEMITQNESTTFGERGLSTIEKELEQL
jgi:hypothetical protein